MFWNDPNLYSVAFKDAPSFPGIPNPFRGLAPRYFNPYFTPYVNPQMFIPPVTPFMHTQPTPPWLDRTMTPYNYNVPNFQSFQNFPNFPNYSLPYFQGYRPYGL